MTSFSYQTLLPEYAEDWQKLRLEGARDFPLGFLVTVDETAAASLDRCRKILGRKGIRGVFADQALVGFCGYRPQELERTKHRGEVGPFFVTRDYQGSGAAKILMTGVIEEARSAGIAQIELFVDTENLRAIAFYERQGFKIVATHHDTVRINGHNRQDHFMTLLL
ncbi:GNAT family N-acetyltransferase [uncultured Ruegeria sp.]|uniref:GNAT family N-acetyltransferase n=1 Tax=uncultured Ruegeria sp. TaxID=259304 RepID=UPI00260E9339|nr:GNAT family N-acetyltransferase [uncultured Ruegeria sp.]